ncbi:hypothetical protein GGR56DRAFT_645374 [Xylariaceae sp. FL0804]|nr:hypothetical protein GGR56DRAFT_645374 [Xylariaceae sp. FL0804]
MAANGDKSQMAPAYTDHGTDLVEPRHQHQHQPQSQPQQQLTPTQAPAYDNNDSGHDDSALLRSPMPATTVAHHGLQVLQAASAAPMSTTASDLVQQYAQSATMQMGESFAAAAASSLVPQQQQHASASAVSPGLGASAFAQLQQQQQHHHHQQKVTRLRRACDMCSQRKVKCDESGPPCKPCSDLQVECTFRRETKRRGPPNRHAEAAKAEKRPRLDEASPVPHNAAAALVSIAENQSNTYNNTGAPGPDAAPTPAMNAESIAPWPVLELLVDDFFTYIHPLMPFPHEPTFRQNFANRLDKTSGEFLALLASMVCILVTSFPRSARAHLKAQQSTGLYPTASTMIDQCQHIALVARGAKFMAKPEMSVDDAATSYFLGLAAAYTLQWLPCKRFMAETMTFCRELGTHRQRDASALAALIPGLAADMNRAAPEPVNHIKDQVGKRIFWVMVAGIRSMTQLGASINELPLPPPTTQEPYPEMPLEVDDEYILADQILDQPQSTLPLIAGFNRNIQIYMTMNELVGVDMCYGINFFDWVAQRNILSNGLNAAKRVVEALPPELQLHAEPGQVDHTGFDEPDLRYYPPAFLNAPSPPNDVRRAIAEQPMRRRQLQCEIQKANIYASHVATRSYFVERYLNLRDAHRARPGFSKEAEDAANANADASADAPHKDRDNRDDMVADERELIVKDLLAVLASVSQRNMEPNGQSLINKIRQVASTLLHDAPERKGPLAVRADDYLGRFLDTLVKLERTAGVDTDNPAAAADPQAQEEEELQHWASLRDYQLQFMSQGGYMRTI